jgi:hypothetical protein
VSRVLCADFSSLMITSARAASDRSVTCRRFSRTADEAWIRAIWNSRFFMALSALDFSDLKVDSARVASFLRRFECS